MAFFNNKTQSKIIDFSEVWSSLTNEYAQIKQNYELAWKSKKKTMIILFCILVFPGLIYYMAVWNRPSSIRSRESFANQLLSLAFQEIGKRSADGWLEEIQTTLSPEINVKELDILNAGTLLNSVNTSLLGATTPASTMHTLLGNIMRTETMPWLTGTFPTDGIVLSRRAKLEHTAEVDFKIHDRTYSAFNLRTSITETKRRTVQTKNGPRTYVATEKFYGFNGMVLFSHSSLSYPYNLDLLSKGFKGSFDLYLSGYKMAELKYSLGSEEFDKAMKLRVSVEDGTEIRKLFQPRLIDDITQISSKSPEFLIRSVHEQGTALLFQQFDRNPHDLCLNIEKTGKFFKHPEKAKKMLDKELSFFVGLSRVLEALGDDDNWRKTY